MGFPSWVFHFFAFPHEKRKDAFFCLWCESFHCGAHEKKRKEGKKFQSQIELAANYCANCHLIESRKPIYSKENQINKHQQNVSEWNFSHHAMKLRFCNRISAFFREIVMTAAAAATERRKRQKDTNKDTVCVSIKQKKKKKLGKNR